MEFQSLIERGLKLEFSEYITICTVMYCKITNIFNIVVVLSYRKNHYSLQKKAQNLR